MQNIIKKRTTLQMLLLESVIIRTLIGLLIQTCDKHLQFCQQDNQYFVTSNFILQNKSKLKINVYVQSSCQYGCLILTHSPL